MSGSRQTARVAAALRLKFGKSAWIPLVLATFVSSMAATPDAPANPPETVDQAFTAAVRQSVGAPARVDIDDQATERLSENMIIVPKDPASRLLTVTHKTIPPDFTALLLGPGGIDAPGIIRFVPAGFIDSNAALAWSADDILSSLNDTIEHENPDRLKQGEPEREARLWVVPPRYNPEMHQLSWAALIVPKNAPHETDGETTYHAIGFGRDGYIELSVVSSVQQAEQIGRMADNFLVGLAFRPGKAYGDVQPSDRRAPAGLAGAMAIDTLHKARLPSGFSDPDTVVPIAGAIVASIGALALLIYIRRHLRRDARRG